MCRGSNSQLSIQKTNSPHFLLTMFFYSDSLGSWGSSGCAQKNNVSACVTFKIIRLRYDLWLFIRKQLPWNYSVFLLMNERPGYFFIFRYGYPDEIILVSVTLRKRNILRQVTGIETEDPKKVGWRKNCWSILEGFQVSGKIFLWRRLYKGGVH